MGEVALEGFGSGSAGGTLTVTAPANVTVTVSKDGKSKIKNSGTSGVVVFKGLASGTWTLTITDGSQTSSKPVVVTADYSTVIAFFAATINITYPAGSTCTATDGTTTLTAPDTSGTWACVVPNAGTWTVTATDGEDSASKDATITADGQSKSLTINYQTFLYNAGDQCTDLTGGWEVSNLSGGASGSVLEDALVLGNSSMTVRTSVFGGSGVYGAANTVNLIDLTNISTIKFTISNVSDSTYLEHCYVGVYRAKPSKFYDDVFAAKVEAKSVGQHTLDVSNLTSGYVAVRVNSTNYQKLLGVTITEIEVIEA
jgi:hypothetical protein